MSRSLDALFDPILGAITDQTRTRWGSFRPYLLWMSAPLALAGVLVFTVPDVARGDELVGPRTPEQLDQNLEALRIDLPAELYERLNVAGAAERLAGAEARR